MAKKAAPKKIVKAKKKKNGKSKIVIHYDVGFPNSITIRGSGPGLSWEKGVSLKNMEKDKWVFEVDEDFDDCEFKVLINDQCYEEGENHHLVFGEEICYTPKFS